MHYWYSSIISLKFVIKFLNKSIDYIFIQRFNVILSFLEIIDRKWQIFKKKRYVSVHSNE